MFLNANLFSNVIKNTPLVSIDLILRNNENKVLLGERLNRPSKNYWFVPGGRILKNESIEAAFSRLTKEELGQEFKITEAKLLGAYDHFYDDNVFNEEFSTHYVALAYTLEIESTLKNLPLNIQHLNYKWFDILELANDPQIHKHTKWYFE